MSKSFDDYRREALASQKSAGASSTSRKKIDLSGLTAASKKQAEDKAPQDPLSWLVDIASRPLRTQTERVDSFLDTQKHTAEKLRKGDTLGAAGESAMGFLDQMTGAGLRGLFSTDKEDQRTSSDLIEKASDTVGGDFDPSYEDVQDNVNPLVKGVAGFAGDVALDPLTYVPGAAFVSVGKKIASLSKLGKGGAKAFEDAARASELTKGTAKVGDEATKAVDDVLSTAAKVEAPSPASTEAAATAKVAETAAVKSPDVAGSLLEKSQVAMSAARLSPKATSLAKGLEAIKPTTLSVEVAKAGKQIPENPLPLNEWVSAAADDMSELTTKQAPMLTNGKQKISLAAVVEKAQTGDPQAMKVLEQWHTTKYLPSFAKAKSAGQSVNALGRIVPKVTPKSVVTEQVLDSMATFRKTVAEDQSAVEATLGKGLTGALMKMANPEKFDATIQRISGILGGKLDVHHLAKSNYTNPVKEALKQIGLDPTTVPVGLRKPQAAKGSARATSIEEMLTKMGDAPEAPLTVQLAEKSLSHSVLKDILEPVTPGMGWDYKTKTGVLRNEDAWGAGVGRRWREANTYFQYTGAAELMREASAALKRVGEGTKGALTAARKHDEVLKAMRLRERFEEQAGVIHTIGVGTDRIPISLSQILDTLEDAEGFQAMRLMYWNQGTAVPHTALMDGVYQALKGGSFDDILEAVSATSTRYESSAGALRPMENNLVRGGKFGKDAYPAGSLPPRLATLIMEKLDKLDSVVSMNDKAWKTRVADEVYDMTDKTLDTLRKAFEDEAGYGPALMAIDNTTSRIRQTASEIGATQKATDVTDAVVKQAVPATEVANAAKAVKVTTTLTKTAEMTHDLNKLQRAGVNDSLEGYYKAVGAEFTPGGDTRDFGTKIQQLLSKGLLSKMMPIVSRRAGIPLMHEQMVRGEVTLKGLVTHLDHRVARVGAKLPKDQFAALLNNVQKGLRPSDPKLAEQYDEVADIWAQMFSDRNGSLMQNAFFRENSNIHHANSLLDYYKTGQLFDVLKAEEKAAENGTTFMTEIGRQASTWQISDPVDFLSKAYKAFATTQVHQNTAHSFMKLAKDLNAVSSAPKKGYSLVGNDSGKSIMAKYLPSNVYFDDAVLRQMHVVDNLMQDSIKWDGPIKDFLDNTFRPIQDAWKYGMTLINPSHHIRNAVSDASMTFYANGVKGARKSYSAAAQGMASHNGYTNWDAVKMLQGMEELPDAGKVVSKGRHGEITAEGLYQAAANRGNLPTFKQLENLEEDGRGAIASKWQDFTNTRGAQVIGGVSEARDHYFRLAHFAQTVDQLIDSPKYRSLSEVLDEASAQTRRWHPDGTDMTSVERDVFRMIIPFYSWQRKAIPMIVEAMLMHPGRVMAIPKAQYNTAVAAGINPDSMMNPFPDDQMFPSYLTEQISGPVAIVDGKYFGLNPGFAANDILNDYGAGPEVAGRSVLGSISPLLRSPLELAAGGQVGTGARINDESDYIDSNLPVVGPLSRMTGTSISGSLASILQGKGLDPQYQVAKGNKEGIEAVPILNWLSGLGITPMSQPNQINYAEIEKRDREAGK